MNKKLPIARCLLGACFGLFMAASAKAASLQVVTNDWGTNGVPSTVSMYIYVPDKLATSPPILVVAHYCGGTAGGVFGEAYGGGIVAACDKYGFIMVFPQAANPDGSGRCWDAGSTSSLTRNGGGDSQAIVNMVNYTVNTYHANRSRVYVTGTSSGAMMTELLLALYPDVFKAGAEFSGVPAGCWAVNNPGGGWSGPCAGGQVSYPAPQWGNIVRGMYQGYSGPRPRVQLWHGTADTTISYNDQTEAIKQWTDVLNLSTNPTTTATVKIGSVTNQWIHQTWQDSCGNAVLDAWSELNGGHGTDANLNAQYVIPFLGLDKTGSADPVNSCAAPNGLAATAISSNQVSLAWNTSSNAASYTLKRAAMTGGPYSILASNIIATNYADTVAVGMRYYYVVSARVSGVETPNSREASANLLYPWLTADIGSVGIMVGNASYNSGVFTAMGAGADIQSTADGFRYVYVPATGNCTIIARVASVQNVNAWSKAGVMIRESLNANAANAFVGLTPGNGTTWQYRSSTGGGTTYNNTAGLNAPYWVKLVRSANMFTGYRSADGITWTLQGTATFTMGSTVYIGLALTSHDTANLVPASFDNVTAPGWTASAPPSAPSNLTATAMSGSQINLIWNSSATASGYNIKRSTANGGPYSIIYSGLGATNYNDTGLPATNTFYYVISALNQSGESINSAQASATTLIPNTPPTLAPVANQTIGAGVTLSITNIATDTNVPTPVLTFGLLSAPTNAAINSSSGVLTWRPLVSQANSTNPFTVMVADDGTPSLSATQSFAVTVNPLAQPQLSNMAFSNGKFVLQVNGDSGPDYQIQVSTNLLDWNTVFTTNSPAMPFTWTNGASESPMNYFRIVVGP